MTEGIPRFTQGQVLFDGPTKLGRYVIVDTTYNRRPARILYTEQREGAQSGLAFDDDPRPLFDYNERFIEIINKVKPKNILLIGGGAFTLPLAINQQFPEIYLDICEIDPDLPVLARKYFGFKNNSKTKVYIGDGRVWLKELDKQYDLILLDVFNNLTIPISFQEHTLADDLKARLTPGGLVAMNVIGAYYGDGLTIIKTMTDVFNLIYPHPKVIPANPDLSMWFSQNYIFVAGAKAKQVS